MEQGITAPLSKESAALLTYGTMVRLSGVIYTARDAAHKKMLEDYKSTARLPFAMTDQIIYYTGPSPARPGEIIGSAGPTTSGRMDAYAPALIALGLRAMIGKGYRSTAVIEAMKRYTAVYFGATGGAGALIADHIKGCELIAYPELGPEAIYKLYVEDFPLTVVIDSKGENLYERAQASYQKK